MNRLLKCALLLAAALAPISAAAQFASVVNGPSSSTGCQHAPGFYYDQVNSVVSSCGNSHVLATLETPLGVFNAQTAVTSVTTAQTIGSIALNANVQAVPTRAIRVCGSGIYTSPGTTTPTITIQVTEGGITPVAITSAAVSGTASTNLPFQFCFTITTVTASATGTLEAHGYLNINISANTAAAAVATYLDTNTAVSSSINLFAANTLAVQVAASSTITSVQLRQMTVELVN